MGRLTRLFPPSRPREGDVSDLFPVPVLAACLVSCPGCWCAVPRPDLRRHLTVCAGRLLVECGVQGEREDEGTDDHGHGGEYLPGVEAPFGPGGGFSASGAFAEVEP